MHIDESPSGLPEGQAMSLVGASPEALRGLGLSEERHLEFATATTVELSISSLLQRIRIRSEGLNAEHVKMLADVPGPLPPIVVHRATMTVVDGVHRLAAARARGQQFIDAVFFDGQITDGYVLALRLNSMHGLPLSRKDRRLAVERIPIHYPSWSDRRVAMVTGVTHKTVASVRERSTEESLQSNARVGRDGHSRPLNATAGRQQAAQMIVEQPAATVRQVARATGLSVATVHDVRRRLASGSSPVPEPMAGERRRRPLPSTPPGNPPACEGPPLRARSAPVNSAAPLQYLRADPSVRATVAGRTLLQLLSVHTEAFAGDGQLLSAVPAHRRELELVARLAT